MMKMHAVATMALLLFACHTGSNAPPARTVAVDGGGRAVDVEVVQQPVPADAGTPTPRYVRVIAREPRSGATLWGHVPQSADDPVSRFLRWSAFRDQAGVIFAAGRLVRVAVIAPPLQLLVDASTTKFPSLAAATAALAGDRQPKLGGNLIDLTPQLESRWFEQHGVAFSPGPALTKLELQGDHLLVTLTGQNGKTAVIVLDSDYRLLEVRKDR